MSEPISLAQALANLRSKMEEDRPAREESADPVDPDVCFWCHQDCGGTCLGVNNADANGNPTGPQQMRTDDPAYWMLSDGKTTSTTVYDEKCYICRDPEFAQMGLPLCKPCPVCTAKEGKDAGHVPADDTVCTVCGADAYEEWMKSQESKGETG